jgi:hypothetical protein
MPQAAWFPDIIGVFGTGWQSHGDVVKHRIGIGSPVVGPIGCVISYCFEMSGTFTTFHPLTQLQDGYQGA